MNTDVVLVCPNEPDPHHTVKGMCDFCTAWIYYPADRADVEAKQCVSCCVAYFLNLPSRVRWKVFGLVYLFTLQDRFMRYWKKMLGILRK